MTPCQIRLAGWKTTTNINAIVDPVSPTMGPTCLGVSVVKRSLVSIAGTETLFKFLSP